MNIKTATDILNCTSTEQAQAIIDSNGLVIKSKKPVVDKMSVEFIKWDYLAYFGLKPDVPIAKHETVFFDEDSGIKSVSLPTGISKGLK